jgi:hypothetical protein
VIIGFLFSAGGPVRADDLSGATQLLCASAEATFCTEDGECVVEPPWSFGIPQFIEVDLDARRLSTTRASNLNRSTPIEHLVRSEGTIVFHGYENGRAFSWVINEKTGHVTAAIAVDGMAVAVFGACTPLATATQNEGEDGES